MKAARTLGILTIQIFLAWTPFFIFSFIKVKTGVRGVETAANALLLFGLGFEFKMKGMFLNQRLMISKNYL